MSDLRNLKIDSSARLIRVVAALEELDLDEMEGYAVPLLEALASLTGAQQQAILRDAAAGAGGEETP